MSAKHKIDMQFFFFVTLFDAQALFRSNCQCPSPIRGIRSKTLRQSLETDRSRPKSTFSHEFAARPIALKPRKANMETQAR